MALARLENFLKNLSGTVLYVDPGQLDSTDSIDNRGNSALRPFKTIQRALLESVRFSYVSGVNNDIFNQTTILLSPGTHFIDNRPGHYVEESTIKTFSGSTSTIEELSLESNFDIDDPQNVLYTYNSIEGGVIVPRGVSIVAKDIRKTKVRPKYVPNPNDDLIERSAIFRLTGACYIFGFSILDGDPNGTVFSSPSSLAKVVPAYSHHKLTAFEYADGKNKQTKGGVNLDKTDLDIYYYKVSLGYGNAAGSPIIIDGYDNLQPNPEENKIVGDLGQGSIQISDIIAGDGATNGTNVITVTTSTDHGLSPFASILISNVGSDDQQRAEYNGPFTVAQVISDTEFTYRVPSTPLSSLNPDVVIGDDGSSVSIVSDTVSSASPYVFNCSLRSVFGMCGLHADGSKATGFKSIVTAQFTGISLQKDDRAFVLYDEDTGTYQYQDAYGTSKFLHQDSRSTYRPEWENFHVKSSNNAFIQCVSIFAIGYAKQFVSESGGDQSITNSNSNFGAISLFSNGFRDYSLPKDNCGYITHIIPPKEISSIEDQIRCIAIDSSLTSSEASSNGNTRVYLKDYTSLLDPPDSKFRGFTIGAKDSDEIFYNSSGTEYSATVSPNYKLEFNIDDIDLLSGYITLLEPFDIGTETGISTSQKVRIVSKNGIIPDGLESNKVYFIHSDITSSDVKLSSNLLNSSSGPTVDIKNKNGASAGNLKLVSKVNDRSPNDVASPIKWDESNNQWYIQIESNSQFISSLSQDFIFYLKRNIDTRSEDDKSYRARIVIPKEFENASEPTTGFIIQNTSSDLSEEYSTEATLTSLSQFRNKNIIIDAWESSGTAHIITKNPHRLSSNNLVEIYNLKSDNEPNPVGLGSGTGFNGSFRVSSVESETEFTYSLPSGVNPGGISTYSSSSETWLDEGDCDSSTYRVPPYTIDSNSRNNLPYFVCKEVPSAYQCYKIDTIQEFSPGSSDGVYYATLNAFKNTPSESPFNIQSIKFSQSIENLYPKIDVDNLIADPLESRTIASNKTIGKVEINDVENSSTKESTIEFLRDYGLANQITQISVTGSTCTITTNINHGLRGIQQLTVQSAGSGFVNGTWYDIPLCPYDGSSQGRGAKVNVTVSGGVVTSASVSYPGSGYDPGSLVKIKGIPHTATDGAEATLSVASVLNNTLDGIQIFNSLNSENNGFFEITSVTPNTIVYENSSAVEETISTAIFIPSGVRNAVSNFSSGTRVVTTSSPNSLSVGNKVYFSSLPGQSFNVVSVLSSTSFKIDGTSDPSVADNLYEISLSTSLRDSNSSAENLKSRQYSFFTGISVRTRNNSAGEISSTDSAVRLVSTIGFFVGDFIQIDEEIMYVTSVAGSNLNISRGLFNTKPVFHLRNSIVRKLNPIPIELRRNSILRASGHTFEYTGYGPGNYSTGMPTNQDRVLSDDEVLISQSLPSKGGLVLYTGMNSDGEFFIGKKKINALTGEEVLLSVPLSEDITERTFSNTLDVTKLTVNRELDASTAEITAKTIEVLDSITTENITINGNFNISSIDVADINGDTLTIGTSPNITTISNGTVDTTTVNATTVNATTVNADTVGVTTVNADTVGVTTLNATTVNATTFVGKGTIPIGGIIMWSGTQAELDQTPEWKLCDGDDGTPDLRNRFIVAAATISKSGTTSQAGADPYDPGDTGGNANAIVPPHYHFVAADTGATSGEDGKDPLTSTQFVSSVGFGGETELDEYRDYVLETSNDEANVGRTSGPTPSDDGANANLPPYYALAFIMRIS